MTPAEHAARLRQTIDYAYAPTGPARDDAVAALDALQAQAENGLDESDLEHQSERRAYWKERAEAAEAERDRTEQLRQDAVMAHHALEAACDSLEAERDRLAARVSELETALREVITEHDRGTQELDDGWSVAEGLGDVARAALAEK